MFENCTSLIYDPNSTSTLTFPIGSATYYGHYTFKDVPSFLGTPGIDSEGTVSQGSTIKIPTA
jgi:hypothetical protein